MTPSPDQRSYKAALTRAQEYLHRPTDPARWWPDPDTHILGGRDLHRAEHGTWLGVTRQGRLAILTNFKEESAFIQGRRSRGAVVNSYLRMSPDSKDSSKAVAHQLIQEGLDGIGGFSLMFGHLRKPSWKEGLSEKHGKWQGLAIVSNRSAHVDDVKWLCTGPGETHALSNSHYGDMSWPKVVSGEKLVNEAICESARKGESKDELLARLLSVLETDTLPVQRDSEGWMTYLSQLKNSIFVPAIGSDEQSETLANNSPLPNGQPNVQAQVNPATSGVYGTQKQTVVLVDWDGKVDYFERTVFDHGGSRVPRGNGDLHHEFQVEGWNE